MLRQVKKDELLRRMGSLNIQESDLVERFVLGSGSGGQKINKTSSCVYLKHLPTGIEVKCQESRSREMNRYRARQQLCDRIQEKETAIKTKRQHEAEKVRRQKRRRSRRSKEKMLANKKLKAEKKSLRKPPSE